MQQVNMPRFQSKRSIAAKAKINKEKKGQFSTPIEAAKVNFPIDNSNLYYSNSSISGIGVFNKERIGEGKKITEYRGELVEPNTKLNKTQQSQQVKEELDKREMRYKTHDRNYSTYTFSLKYGGGFIDATREGNESRFINHSCDPNCVANELSSTKKTVINSLREIPPNSELTLDYKLKSTETCLCGAKNCKGKM